MESWSVKCEPWGRTQDNRCTFESYLQKVKVEMMDLMNSQRVKDIYKGYRKIIIGKGKEEINEPHKDQPGKRIRAEVMETKRRVLTLCLLFLLIPLPSDTLLCYVFPPGIIGVVYQLLF